VPAASEDLEGSMSVITDGVRLPLAGVPASRVVAVAAREVWLVLLVAAYTAFAAVAIPYELVQDGWLALVSGREIAANGLPSVDGLTVWTQGREWVDQQWLAQLSLYGLHALGGIKLVLVTHVALMVCSFAGAVLAARVLGASAKAVALAGLVCITLAPWALQMRTQSLAMPLFVLVFALLCADSRRPSAWVFLTLPLLALWANLHGTVVIAAGLVVLRGLTCLVAGERSRGAVLVLVPPACVFASPYGLELVGYYQSLYLNPALKAFIDEWGASEPSQRTATFYLLAGACVWLLGRYRQQLTGFEQIALAVMTVAGVMAIRSIAWFALAALILLPRLLEPALGRAREASVLVLFRAALAAAGATVILGAFVVVASQPSSWFEREWPHAGAAELAELARERPAALVFSDDRYADWLMWAQPSLQGRIAHDVRYELFQPHQFAELYAYRSQSGDWRRVARPYDLFAFDPRRQPRLLAELRREGLTVEHREPGFVLLARP
jgi:hypothetical protein